MLVLIIGRVRNDLPIWDEKKNQKTYKSKINQKFGFQWFAIIFFVILGNKRGPGTSLVQQKLVYFENKIF